MPLRRLNIITVASPGASNYGTIYDDPDSKMKFSADDDITSPLRTISNNNIRVRENHYLLLILAFFMRSIDVLLACFFIYYLVLYVILLITYNRRGRIVKEYLSMNSKDKESLP